MNTSQVDRFDLFAYLDLLAGEEKIHIHVGDYRAVAELLLERENTICAIRQRYTHADLDTDAQGKTRRQFCRVESQPTKPQLRVVT